MGARGMTALRQQGLSRRELLSYGGAIVAGAIAASMPGYLFAQEMAKLDVASAGSFRSMLEGPFKTAIARALQLDLHAHAQGADAVAQSIVDGSLSADVFIPITAGPMETVMRAGKADTAIPIARTELVLVYSPKSRFASQFEAAASGKGNWWEVLQEPGIRIGRGNPAGDPGGRTILFAMMLAAKKYHQADLAQKVLGPTLNPAQIVPGVLAGLQNGSIDATTSYRIGVVSSGLPYISLPQEINLTSANVHTENPEISLIIQGKTFYPEPLVFYAGSIKNSANPKGASALITWLQGKEAQSLLQQNQFDLPRNAMPLTLKTPI